MGLPLSGGRDVRYGIVGGGLYVSHHQNTFTQCIATRTIIYLCQAVDWRPGSRVIKRREDNE